MLIFLLSSFIHLGGGWHYLTFQSAFYLLYSYLVHVLDILVNCVHVSV